MNTSSPDTDQLPGQILNSSCLPGRQTHRAGHSGAAVAVRNFVKVLLVAALRLRQQLLQRR